MRLVTTAHRLHHRALHSARGRYTIRVVSCYFTSMNQSTHIVGGLVGSMCAKTAVRCYGTKTVTNLSQTWEFSRTMRGCDRIPRPCTIPSESRCDWVPSPTPSMFTTAQSEYSVASGVKGQGFPKMCSRFAMPTQDERMYPTRPRDLDGRMMQESLLHSRFGNSGRPPPTRLFVALPQRDERRDV